MAKVKSTLFSMMRGSIAGTTFLAGPTCAIIARTRTVPVNPSTNYQDMVRFLSWQPTTVDWNTISPARRTGWAAWARTVTIEGPQGPYNPTGRAIFIGIHTLRHYLIERGAAFAAPIPPATTFDPPTVPGLIATPRVVQGVFPAGGGVRLVITNLSTESLNVYAVPSIGYNPARSFFKGPFFTPSLNVQQLLPAPGQVNLDFGGLTTGLAYFFMVRGISYGAPHRETPCAIIRCIAD